MYMHEHIATDLVVDLAEETRQRGITKARSSHLSLVLGPERFMINPETDQPATVETTEEIADLIHEFCHDALSQPDAEFQNPTRLLKRVGQPKIQLAVDMNPRVRHMSTQPSRQQPKAGEDPTTFVPDEPETEPADTSPELDGPLLHEVVTYDAIARGVWQESSLFVAAHGYQFGHRAITDSVYFTPKTDTERRVAMLHRHIRIRPMLLGRIVDLAAERPLSQTEALETRDILDLTHPFTTGPRG